MTAVKPGGDPGPGSSKNTSDVSFVPIYGYRLRYSKLLNPKPLNPYKPYTPKPQTIRQAHLPLFKGHGVLLCAALKMASAAVAYPKTFRFRGFGMCFYFFVRRGIGFRRVHTGTSFMLNVFFQLQVILKHHVDADNLFQPDSLLKLSKHGHIWSSAWKRSARPVSLICSWLGIEHLEGSGPYHSINCEHWLQQEG